MTKILHPLAKMRKLELMGSRDLCIKMECSYSTVRAIEGGERKPTQKQIDSICEIFDRSEVRLRAELDAWAIQKEAQS